MRACFSVVLVVVAGCGRITVSLPDGGTGADRVAGTSGSSPSCGGSVAVTTQLAPGTLLTNEECDRVCGWSGRRPISGPPGCVLQSQTSVYCNATAYDCGYCVFGCQYAPSSCGSGCCDGPSNCCKATSRSCRGLFCGACPQPDARCSLEACRSFKACGGQLAAEPRASVCGDLTDAGIDLAEYCPDACTVADAGAVVQEGCSGPSDAGTIDEGTTDTTDAGACDCDATRSTCEAACPQTSARECLDCAANCAIDFARCAARCR